MSSLLSTMGFSRGPISGRMARAIAGGLLALVAAGPAAAATMTWYFDLPSGVTTQSTLAAVSGSIDFDTVSRTITGHDISVSGVTVNVPGNLNGIGSPGPTPALNGSYDIATLTTTSALFLTRDLDHNGQTNVGDAGMLIKAISYDFGYTLGPLEMDVTFGFCVYVISGNCAYYRVGSSYGALATTTPPSPPGGQVPLPASLPLFGSVLALSSIAAGVRRRRRHRAGA